MTHRSLRWFALAAVAVVTSAGVARAERATGIDVSAWQGASIDWQRVAGSGIDFAFIRASRGGTTGTYNQSTRVGTLSERYDDPYFAANMTRATNAGVLAGAYHFARPDIGTNTGVDEANHFLAVAGAYMTPGYLRPVLDMEAGSQRSAAELTRWALDFSDRILAVAGVRPIVYVNTSYATSELTPAINAHDLWLARYTLYDDGSSADGTPRPTAADAVAAAALVQTIAPPTPAGYASPYGVWNATGPAPWDFWQYTNAGRVAGITGYVDTNVANGDVNFVRTFLVPEPTTTLAAGSLAGIVLRRRRRP